MFNIVLWILSLMPSSTETAWTAEDYHSNIHYTRKIVGECFVDSFARDGVPWAFIHGTGVDYERGFYVSPTRMFYRDHTKPWDGVEAEIHR